MSWYNVVSHNSRYFLKMYITEITKFSRQSHYRELSSWAFFVTYIQLLFYSDAFAKVKFMERTLPSTLDHWPHCQITGCQNVSCIFNNNWWRLRLTSDSVHSLETSKSNWQPREVADTEVDCFLPSLWINNISFHSSSSLTILFLVLMPWSFLRLLCAPFALLWPGNIIPLSMCLRPLPCLGGNPISRDCRTCHNAGDGNLAHHKLLLTSSASVSSEQTQPPLLCP